MKKQAEKVLALLQFGGILKTPIDKKYK